ncbi:MAG: DUF2809 domain-containing protein [Nostocales cyanobacterium]|nr:MAG: DUF2809 domain-containing protein [Nostocales cyanobacterium]TAF17505.1 MAG: DUF2809 domain-containing protein [Nostocales cyanobacterium]
MILFKKVRLLTFISLIVILIIGLLYSKYRYSVSWLNQEVGGVFYVIFWCLLAFLFIPSRRAVWQIPLWVLAITCLIEFLQLWKTPSLDYLRSFWWGKMVLGNVFNWADFPYYFIGYGLGWIGLKMIWNLKDKHKKSARE